MGRRYTEEERRETLKMAEEIGGAGAAARRFRIQEDTLYGWRGRKKQQQAALEQDIGGRSEADLLAENEQLRMQLKQAQQDVEILQAFFAKRRKP
ncbi:transposase [Candidatus Avoscillospira sp. LCP25S3_F1]|uniref:transposase n=1 Tax=Candidatus Avoscillospira sp. LCP25S3_F1 TaxID=3438825 RepID=UPI003F93187F